MPGPTQTGYGAGRAGGLLVYQHIQRLDDAEARHEQGVELLREEQQRKARCAARQQGLGCRGAGHQGKVALSQLLARIRFVMSLQDEADELLLRIDRMQFEPYRLVEPADLAAGETAPLDMQGFHNIGSICAYISENFREDIDAVDIASSADIHPKYAMSVFKKSTGMTLNEYVNLLRLSYAQAMLLRDRGNVLQVAMESGFGSLSAFNKSFRKISGMSPTDFRRESRVRYAMN